MLACVFGLLITAALLVTTTFAWFANSVSAPENYITSSYCTVEAVVDDQGFEIAPIKIGSDDVYSLSAGVKYTFKVTVEGTASGGYIKLYLGDAPTVAYYSANIYSDSYIAENGYSDNNYISFSITFDSDKRLTLKSGWGLHRNTDFKLEDGKDYRFNELTRLFEIQ